MAGLQWADYLIFAFFLLASLAIGVYHAFSGKQRTTQEFIMADRNLKVLPTVLSLVVSFVAAGIIIGSSAEVYSYGTKQWFGDLLGFAVAIIFAERLFVPWIFPLKLTSVYEMLYIGTSIYAPSLALEAATGFPTKASIPIMAAAATTYTALGGMRAVIWTDVFQSAILLCGVLAVITKGCMEVGGISEVFHYAQEEGRILGFSTSFDPRERSTIWGSIFGWGTSWAFIYGLQQMSTQRYSATASLRDARLSLLLTIPCLLILASLFYLNGFIVLAYFAKERCDPLLNGDINSSNQILPYFVKIVFASTRGFSGLFLATLYSGALSSVSSSLSGCAANAWEDILKPHFVNLSDFRAAVLNKCLVVAFGFIGAAVAFLAAIMPGPVSQVAVSFLSATGGPLHGMFILGGISDTADWQGALLGCGAGCVLNLVIIFGSWSSPAFSPTLPPLPSDYCPMFNGTLSTSTANATSVNASLHGMENLYAVSFLWYALIGCSVTVTVGWISSQIFNIGHKKGKKDIDARLRLPWRAVFTFATLPPIDIDENSYHDIRRAELAMNRCPVEINRFLLFYHSIWKSSIPLKIMDSSSEKALIRRVRERIWKIKMQKAIKKLQEMGHDLFEWLRETVSLELPAADPLHCQATRYEE
ncbi:hypothetical protein CAPTEDRAFT_196722 [Capitella teleta]|uniref:Sodium-dependent multivitamin transporter n=1 Tax=Capitella teleta TaxID=283909 RepID=R7UFI4_CAPTE|nr:hypothetical protein CAPTEDRAFT_196722 [Capitella teleta]|eukprot:ELU02543.1 hypothetical protein CAPTEDRAFT_196722 [Capitella teleta]